MGLGDCSIHGLPKSQVPYPKSQFYTLCLQASNCGQLSYPAMDWRRPNSRKGTMPAGLAEQTLELMMKHGRINGSGQCGGNRFEKFNLGL